MKRPFIRFWFQSLFFSLLAAIAPAPLPAQSTPAVSKAREISSARSAWTRDSVRIAELLRKMRSKSDALTNVENEIARLREALADLQREKIQALEDMMGGEFCTGCGRTRRDLLSKGEPFPHPGQDRRPATPEELRKAESEYDEKIARLRGKIREEEKKLENGTNENRDFYHEYLQRVASYHQQMLNEQNARQAEWGSEKDSLEKELDTHWAALSALLKTASTGPGKSSEGGDAATTEARVKQRQFDAALQKASSAETRAKQKSAEFVSTVRKDMDNLVTLAAPLPDKFGLPGGWFISKSISTPPLPLDCVILLVMRPETPGGATSVDDLLGPAARRSVKPAKPTPQSMKDFLESK